MAFFDWIVAVAASVSVLFCALLATGALGTRSQESRFAVNRWYGMPLPRLLALNTGLGLLLSAIVMALRHELYAPPDYALVVSAVLGIGLGVFLTVVMRVAESTGSSASPGGGRK